MRVDDRVMVPYTVGNGHVLLLFGNLYSRRG
jgi:hypothetical protein